MKPKIFISLACKSHESQSLLRCQQELEKICQILIQNYPQADFSCRSIGLPKDQKYITILRSPHVHKKSREQFVYKVFKFAFFYEFSHTEMANDFLFAIKQLEIPGIEMKVTLKEWKYLQNIV